jgi:hypothetical protein
LLGRPDDWLPRTGAEDLVTGAEDLVGAERTGAETLVGALDLAGVSRR